MPRSSSEAKDDTKSEDARLHEAFRIAAVTIILFDPFAAKVLLNLPDEELGRRFKVSLMRVTGLSTVLDLDLRPIQSQRGRRQSARTNVASSHRTLARQTLVAEGKLVRAVYVCNAYGISEKRLKQDVALGRIFTVVIGRHEYLPTFFLAKILDPTNLAKVVRKLAGLTGWRMWDFFTTPKTEIENLTPLQALAKGEVKQVLRTATAFVKG